MTTDGRNAEPDLTELTSELDEATKEVAKALRASGGNEDDRAYKNAVYLRRIVDHKVAAARQRIDQRARLNGMPVSEIVDKAMGR
jgi:hypothetical protein